MKNLLRALFSMGLLGWVFLLMAVAIFAGSFAAITNLTSFQTNWQRVDALEVMEGEVSTHLSEVQLNELSFAYALDYEAPLGDQLEAVDYHTGEIARLLDDLTAQGHFTADLGYEDVDIALFDNFRALLDQHRQSFAAVVETYNAGDVAGAVEGTLALQEEHEELQAGLHELVSSLDAYFLYGAQEFSQNMALTLQRVSIALVAMLLLVLGGYRAIVQITRPVVDLANVVIAIGGDRYRPEMLGGLLKQRGPVGRLARALNAYARGIEGRDAGLKTEIGSLREQMYESRRRRLKISSPGR